MKETRSRPRSHPGRPSEESPRPVLISGYFGFGNVGDEAILAGVVEELRRRTPAIGLIVISGNPRETARGLGVEAIPFADPHQISAAVQRSGRVLFGLGGVFQDYWGAHSSSLFFPDTNGIEAYLRPALLARLHGVPATLFGAGVGPLRSAEGRALFALACSLSDLVIVRDEASAEEVRGVSPAPVATCGDPAFLLGPPTPREQESLSKRLASRGIAEPFVAFALRSWRFELDDDELAGLAAEAAGSLPPTCRALFVPLHRGSGTDDGEIAAAAAKAAGERAAVFEVESPKEAVALFAKARAVVGMRLHSVVLAALGGTPSVPLVYDPKVRSAAEKLGLGDFAVSLDEPEKLAISLGNVLDAGDALRERLSRFVAGCRSAASFAFDVLEVPSVLAAGNEPRTGTADAARPLEEVPAASQALRRLVLGHERRVRELARQSAPLEILSASADFALQYESNLERLTATLHRALRENARAQEARMGEALALRSEIAAVRNDAATAERRAESQRWELEDRLEESERRTKFLEAQLEERREELLKIHRSRFWKTASAYWDARRRVKEGLSLRTLFRRSTPEGAPREWAADPSLLTTGDVSASPENRHDVVCFPIIDWDFRFQRPQQLMKRFAEAGHRVFYVSQQFRPAGAPYEIRTKAPNVFEVSLRGLALNVYRDTVDPKACDALAEGLDALRRDRSLGATACVVQLPFWLPLAKRLRDERAWPIVYDLMDHHAGFSSNLQAMLEQERELLETADLVLASSAFLEEEARKLNPRVIRLPNACDYDHFARVRPPDNARPTIGYYGAISEWFDSDLVADLAERRPDWDFLLVGSTWGADVERLSKLPNVSLPGEKPYAEIPRWLERMDVALIPFKRVPLTEATNPVKAYEILAAGRPLVAVPLPEIAAMAPLVRLAPTAEDFEREIAEALVEQDPPRVEERKAFARDHTWEKRFGVLSPAVRDAFPRASIVVVTFQNVTLNRMCIESIYARTEWANFEVLVVDNASSDGTLDYLREAEWRHPNLRVLRNEENRGFAAANNQGLKEATGRYLILLNNDTVVSRGWATSLIRHLHANPRLGLVGPVTNEIGNEAKVEVSYRSLAGMPEWAARHVREHDGETFALPMLAMFCVATRRDVLDRVGLLDERFGLGMFEDDDYTRRVKQEGYGVACARDSFVHHAGRASFKLLGEAKYLEIFEENRVRYQQKWGEMWEPHLDEEDRHRIASLRARLTEIVQESGVPAERIVIFLPSIGWTTPLVQRPHHLARALARLGYLVLFDCTGSVLDYFADFTSVERNLWLYKGPQGVLESLERPILWTLPYNAARSERYRHPRVVYDFIDDLSVFPYNPERLREQHEQALRGADVVLCVARGLVEQVREARPDALYVPNGVEYEAFAQPEGAAGSDGAVAEFLAGDAPVAGYYGAIASWFDSELLTETARARPDWKFVVIGKELADAPALEELRALPNARVFGPQPYASLPGILSRFTAAMIPFLVNEITTATSPLKMYEYFAGGVPVLATPMPECEAFAEVHIVRGVEDFSRSLDQARREASDEAFVERLRALGRENSWTVRARTALAELEKQPSRPEAPPAGARPAPRPSPEPTSREGGGKPDPYRGMSFLPGRCNVCGQNTRFYFSDPALYRESLYCAECRTTSRYRSIARGILQAIRLLSGVEAADLTQLAGRESGRRLSLYDTQVSFRYEGCAYPLPELLGRCKWIDVQTSVYQPGERPGRKLGPGTTNQNLEKLTFPDASFDVVVTSDVMEHVRLDDLAHREIRRILRPGGIYLFTVPHFRAPSSFIRVQVVNPADASKDVFLTEKEYHGDANADGPGALSYRSYGTDLDDKLTALGFEVSYSMEDRPQLGIMNTELFFCRFRG